MVNSISPIRHGIIQMFRGNVHRQGAASSKIFVPVSRAAPSSDDQPQLSQLSSPFHQPWLVVESVEYIHSDPNFIEFHWSNHVESCEIMFNLFFFAGQTEMHSYVG